MPKFKPEGVVTTMFNFPIDQHTGSKLKPKGNPTRPMNKLSSFPELKGAFEPTERGVVGPVDNLLGLCQEHALQLDWQANRCRVRPLGAEPRDSTEIPLTKSVFRALLARMAVLCNERNPGSVSPYGGEGEVWVGTSPPSVFRVAFTNTPGEQALVVRRLADANDEATGGNGPVEVGQSTRTK